MAIKLSVKIEWLRDPAFFLGLTGNASYADAIISDNVRFETTFWGNGTSGNTLMTRDQGSYRGELVVPIGDEVIRYVEEDRDDRDVSLRLDMRYMWQEAIPVPVGNGGETRLVAGTVLSDTTTVYDCVIKRSDWIKLLGEMKWQEYRLVEIPTQPLLAADPKLEIALKRLHEAQSTLRAGDYSGVLTKCRAAFESAAKYQGAGDTKKGFESLLEHAFGGDEKKQAALNGLIARLSDYAHIGRHEHYPAIHISREEAEFVFATSVSLFSLLGRRLVDND